MISLINIYETGGWIVTATPGDQRAAQPPLAAVPPGEVMTDTTIPPAMRTRFIEAEIDPDDLVVIPGRALHTFMVDATGYLDLNDILMFDDAVGGRAIASFMHYIGEEKNRAVVGVGRGIAAFQLYPDRAESIRRAHHAS